MDEQAETEQEGIEIEEMAPPLEEIPEDVFNLVPHFLAERGDDKTGENTLKKWAQQALDDFKEDRVSMEGWLKKRAARNKVIWGDIDPKSFPWDGCANMHLPVMLERILRITHRIYGEIFQPNEVIATAVSSGSRLSKDEAEVLTLHMHQQFLKDMPDFGKQNRRALFEMVAHGDEIFFSHRDRSRGVNRHVHLSVDEIAFPYFWKTDFLDMSDVPRISRIIRKTKNELQELQDSGEYHCVDKIFAKSPEGSYEDGIEVENKDQADAIDGRDRFESKSTATYTLIEQHTWRKMPGDVRERPVVIVTEKATGICVCLYIREAEDPRDRTRYNRQLQQFNEYMGLVSQYTEAKTLEMQAHDRLAAGDIPPDEEAPLREAIVSEDLPMPEAPAWMKHDEEGNPMPPEKVKAQPINMFSHQVCIENPDGSLGIGIGSLLQGANDSVDTMLNQYIDSATVDNAPATFVKDDVLPPGTTNISPGQVIRVSKYLPDGLDKAVFRLQGKGANDQLLKGIEMLLGGADGVSSAPDAMSGEREGPETYRGFAGRIEQATKQLTIVAQNHIELLSQLIRNNARLNYQFMDEAELYQVLDPRTNKVQGITVKREMYEETFDVTFIADVRFASKAQKIAEWDDVLGMLTKGIPPQLAPMILKPQIFAEVVRGGLKVRGFHSLTQYVNTDEEIEQKLAQPPMPPGMPGPGGPTGAPPVQPGGAPPPSIPTGAPNMAPGEGGGRTRPPEGSPVESGAGQ
jgi:hypothetical protein